jgi:acyl-coenzyme A synthetase/AMP-(fatty) acid ligase
MDTLPLLTHDASPIAYREGRAIGVERFLSDAWVLAGRLPRARHVLNVCADRYRFAVGLAACLLSDRVSLLPPTQTPEVIRRLRAFAPDLACLTDRDDCDIELPRLCWTETPAVRVDAREAPGIARAQLAAIVFTSGSTGVPLPHRKTWGRLVGSVRAAAALLGLEGRRWTLIGTVPPQHMYGFESTVLLAFITGHAFAAERPFYPADVAAAIRAAPRPRALVTTPVHLRALLSIALDLPALDLIVSATAPLERDLAREAERRFDARLVEIYGSTETGMLATRRTTEGPAWRLWPGTRLRLEDGIAYASGGHIEQATALGDVIEMLDEQHFLLHGRTADLVNVAGKRSSLAYLDAQLLAIPGVRDGAFFWPEGAAGGHTGVARLAAAVVAPGLSAAALLAELRIRIDTAFLPRPLLLVDRLPRNATGKLPRDTLDALAARGRREARER